MKKLILPLCLLLAGMAQAQVRGTASEQPAKREGTITYERVLQMRRAANVPDELAAQLPKERTDVFELLYGNGAALWRNVPTAEGDGNTFSSTGPGGERMIVRMPGGNSESYFNFEKGQRVDRRELFDNEFIVVDTIQRLPWKLSEETKTILGHLAHKATAQRIGQRMSISNENGEMKRVPVADTAQIEAWYTTDIPVSVGPQDFQGQLPGAVLEVNVNRGRQVFRAVEIKDKVSLSAIKEPKGGKRLTTAEFQKESDKLLENMRANMPPGAQFRIQN